MLERLYRIALFSLFVNLAIAQSESFHITIISDSEEGRLTFFEPQIKSEIEALLAAKYEVIFEELYAGFDPARINAFIDRVYDQPETRLIIGTGLTTCTQLARRGDYPKPTIAAIIIDNELQNIPITAKGTSGVSNFTYVQSPFDIARDFSTLREILPYEKVALIGDEMAGSGVLNLQDFFARRIDAAFVYLPAREDVRQTLAALTDDVDAVYIMPLFNAYQDEQIEELLNGLAARKLPAFALLDDPMLKLGAYGAYASEDNLQKLPRRIALNVAKIADGQNAADLPVSMPAFTENLVLNMKTIRATGIYPNWDILARATLININEVQTDRIISLKSAIAEGLENNLGLRIAQKETQIAEKDVGLARSNYLPQIGANTTGLLLDKSTVNGAFGTKGRFNWTAGVSLTQLILSEPALANIAIQRLLLESQRQNQRQTELDVILDAAQAYLGVLQAREFVNLQNDNVAVTKKNYDIAQAKEQVGYTGAADVYRWQSQLALNNADLNQAQARLRQARFNLNQMLNRPIRENFRTTDVSLADSILLVLDSRLFTFISNPGDIEVFGDFLVAEAFRNLPEIKQIQMALAAQERALLSQNRAFYLPTVGLSGNYDYTIGNYAVPENLPPVNIQPSWNAAVAVQLPVFQGAARKIQKEQTQVTLMQLQDQLANLRNLLELQVRSNLETAGASFSNLRLSREAAAAARQNFEIVQNSYRQGLLNITSLIDAQNAALQSEINATNAAYKFMADFLAVERSIGRYHFLSTAEDQTAFFQRFAQFLGRE